MNGPDRPEGRPRGVGTPSKSTKPRLDWSTILPVAAEIVSSYNTGVTLRQLFYRLVSKEMLPNTPTSYKSLSSRSAAARRAGSFPALIDRGRNIDRQMSWTSPDQALTFTADTYRRDRTEGQPHSVYLGVEKSGMVNQLEAWFSDLGLPLLALGGYSSQSFVDEVRRDVERQGRPAVLLYGGDHDPSGEDIDRDFVGRTGCWHEVVRVALTAEQVAEHDLPPLPGKAGDSRAAAFADRHGGLVQVELDALPPPVLRRLYSEAIRPWWDSGAYAAALRQEDEDKTAILARIGQGGAL